MDVPRSLFIQGIRTLLVECFEGPRAQGTWIVSQGPDAGLLPFLERIDASAASRRRGQHPSIAAHANHLRFSLSLANRWAAGENPYSSADWNKSWAVQEIGPAEWEKLRSELKTEYERWREAVDTTRDWDAMSVTGIMSSVAHTAYHLGALRQNDPVVSAVAPPSE